MARPRTDIQPRVLHAARARFLEDGVEGASLRAIAKDARTNIGMVFYYYPTKDELFLAVVEEVYAKLLASLDEILSAKSPVRDRLAAAFERLGDASDEELDVLRLVAREALLSSERFRAVLGRFRTGHIALLLRTLAEAIEQGEIATPPPLPILLVGAMGIGGVPQVIRRVAGKNLPFALPSAKELAKSSVTMLFDGVGAKRKTKKKARAVASRSRRR